VKAEKLWELSEDELRVEETRLTEEFFKLRVQKATSQLDNPKRLWTLRKDIARVKTVRRARELGRTRGGEVKG
jgi:large subunit ribosomal protein L29